MERKKRGGADAPRRLSSGAVVVRREGDSWRYLLLRAYRNWDFPKGMVEPGEDPLRAAMREVREETGLVALRLPWGEGFRETEPYAGGKVARFHIALATDGKVTLPVSPELGRPEHQEYRWAAYAQARELLAPRLQAILDWASGVVEGSPAKSEAKHSGRDALGWMTQGAAGGDRGSRLASLARHLLERGVAPAAVLDLMLCWNHERCRPPLADDEVAAIVDGIRADDDGEGS